MEADMAHCLAMAQMAASDPSAAREEALWRQIAGEFEAFLRPPVVVEPLFPVGADPPG